jgi:MFS family permease
MSAPPAATAFRTPAARRPSPRSRSRRALRLLWAGQSVSLLGDQVTVLALPLAALADGASAAQVAVLVGATRAPFLLLGLPAGVWVSRVGLRRSMLLADLLRAAALASLPAAAAFGAMSYLLLLAVAPTLGCGSVLFQVAYQSLTPLLVDDIGLLRAANTRLTASEALALIGGPALAGLLAGAVGAARALAADAGSYLASAGTLTAMRAPADRPAGNHSSMRTEIGAGIRYLLGNPPLRAVLWSSMLFNAGLAGYEALLVVFAIGHLGLSPEILGLAVGSGGTGVPVGLLLSGPVQRRLGVGPVLILSAALSGAGLLVAGTAAGPLPAAVIGLGTFITAVGGGAWGLTALTTRQTLSRPDKRAMTTAVFRWATYGVLPLGALLAGLTATLLGPRPAILLAAAISQLCVVPLLRPPLRALRTLTPATATPAHASHSQIVYPHTAPRNQSPTAPTTATPHPPAQPPQPTLSDTSGRAQELTAAIGRFIDACDDSRVSRQIGAATGRMLMLTGRPGSASTTTSSGWSMPNRSVPDHWPGTCTNPERRTASATRAATERSETTIWMSMSCLAGSPGTEVEPM